MNPDDWEEQREDGYGRSRMAGVVVWLCVGACLAITVGLIWFGVAIGGA